MTPYQLARLRTSDTLETGEPLWLCGSSGGYAQAYAWLTEGERALHSRAYEQAITENEKGVARWGYILPHARHGVDWPHWVAAKAAFLARELRAWHSACDSTDEARDQLALFRDVAGEGWPADPRWPEWRTDTVRLVARGIYRDRAFDQLPILADALQDAGCDDDSVLSHCRDAGREHTRGCWVVDLATGKA